MKMHRRSFLQGCCAGIAAMSGARLTNMTFAQTPGSPQKVLITVFLRGGMDALNFVVPHGDTLYHNARSTLGLDTNQVLDIDSYFGLHPSAAPLKEIYDSQQLTFIHATGIPDADGTRSHFDAQDYFEFGGSIQNQGGWLGRYLKSRSGQDNYAGLFRGISFSSSLALSLNGFNGALAMSDTSEFTLRGSGQGSNLRRALREMYSQDPDLGTVANNTLNAIDMLDANPVGDYTPRPGVTYPENGFGETLASVAQLIKSDLGLQAATVDLGGWDTHEAQSYGNPVAGPYADLVANMSSGLAAFWNDLEGMHDRVTVVFMSEFGRRLKQNSNNGTDHGHGGVMGIFNPRITEKKVFGEWPGLDVDNLYERQDLRVTNDFRRVLAEILASEFNASDQDLINYFPGYQYGGPIGFLPFTEKRLNEELRVY